MIDASKDFLQGTIRDFNCDFVEIRNINAMCFNLFNEPFPITLLEFTVQLIRKKNIPIHWHLAKIHYLADDDNFYLYRKEEFWKLIENQDVLYSPEWTEQIFIRLHEQFLQLISHAQLQAIYFRVRCKETEKIEGIFENIKKVTKTTVYSYRYRDVTFDEN